MAVAFKHLDTLRLFVEVSQFGSLTDAAQALNRTKGAISYQIKTLEADLGFAVFVRTPRGVVLTDAGRNLLALSGRIFWTSKPHWRISGTPE